MPQGRPIIDRAFVKVPQPLQTATGLGVGLIMRATIAVTKVRLALIGLAYRRGRSSGTSARRPQMHLSGAAEPYLQFSLTNAMLGRLGRGST
jgi:hypothetical protein